MRKFEQGFARNIREEAKFIDGKRVTFLRFRGVLKYRVENPDYVKRPAGTDTPDTRKPSQKRNYIWKQVGKELECRKGRSQKQTDKNISDAIDAWEKELELEEGTPKEAKQTVVDFVKEFVTNKRNSRTGGELALATRDNYRFAVLLVDRPALKIPLRDVKARDISKWLKDLKREGAGDTMANKAFRVLSQALDSAARLELIGGNPCTLIGVNEGKPMPKKATVEALNENGVKYINALLDNLNHSTMADCSRWALLCGMRIGEICGLRLADIDGWESGDYGDVHVRQVITRTSAGESVKPCPKSGKPRSIHINKPMAELISYRVNLLREQAESLNAVLTENEFLFGTFTGGDGKGFVRTSALSKQFTSFARANNVVGDKGNVLVFHGLRHSYAAGLINKGANAAHVAQVLGHASPDITLRVYFEYFEGATSEVQEQAAEVMTKKAELANVVEFPKNGTTN